MFDRVCKWQEIADALRTAAVMASEDRLLQSLAKSFSLSATLLTKGV